MSETTTAGPLTPEELARLDAYWRAANYLSVGQIPDHVRDWVWPFAG